MMQVHSQTPWRLCALAVAALVWPVAAGQSLGPRAVFAGQEEPASSDAATRQYAAAAALQNREQYDLAAEEWSAFLATYADHPRAAHARHYLGICLLKSKQYGPAREAFQKVVADDPKFELLASTHLHLGLTEYNLALAGDADLFAKAGETFAALTETYPESKEVPQALFYWGESLYARGKKDEAALMYAELVREHPQDPLLPDALYALGVTQEELGQMAAAGAAYDAYLKGFADGPLADEVKLRKGQTLFAQGQLDQAEKLFAAVADKNDFALADLAAMRQATCLYERRQYEAAAAVYASVPARFADSQYVLPARLAAGKCAYLAGQFAQARDELTAVLASGGETAFEAAHWLARSQLKLNQPAEALQVAEAHLPAASGPYAIQLKLDRADALYELPDRRAESVALYAALASDHPDDVLAPQALYMAAFASLGLAQHEPALAYATGFLQRFAAHELAPDVQYVAAECHLQLGRYADATRLYGELLASQAGHDEAPTWQVRRGLALYLQKQYAAAVDSLASVAPSLADPALAAEAYYLIGSSQNELKQFEAAASALAASLKADPKWRQADEALLALALSDRELGDRDAANSHLVRLVRDFPASRVLDRAHYRLGEYAYADGDLETAAAEYRVVVTQFPNSSLASFAVYGLGWTQLGQGDAAAAVQTLDELISSQSAGELLPRARYARALARHQLKQYAPAIDDLQAFLTSRPGLAETSDAQYVLGLCLAGLGKHAEAADTLGDLLTDDPQYAGADKALYELAWALKSQDKGAEAAEAFGRLAKEHSASPLVAESLYHVGELEYHEGQYKRAAEAYYEAVQRANAAKSAELGEKAAHKLGWAFFQQNQMEKARQAFNYQRTAFPQGSLFGDAAFMEAEVLFKQQKYPEALAAYEAVKSPSGKDFAVLTLLHAGQAAAQLKQWDKSLELLERASREHAKSDYLPEILYEQAWAKQNLGKADDALTLYESVTARTDREVAARARFMIGEIHFERKNHGEAIKSFFKVAYAYAYPQWQANAHYEAGRCFEVLKKTKEARDSYQTVVEKFPKSDKADLAKQRLEALKGSTGKR